MNEYEVEDLIKQQDDNAMKWATAFCQQYPQMDLDVMLGWFANLACVAMDKEANKNSKRSEENRFLCSVVGKYEDALKLIAGECPFVEVRYTDLDDPEVAEEVFYESTTRRRKLAKQALYDVKLLGLDKFNKIDV